MRSCLSLVLPLLCLAGTAAADTQEFEGAHAFRNGGFESGNFGGWALNANFSVVMNRTYDGFAARSGDHYALLGPRGADGTLSQRFTDSAGDTLQIGWWLASDGAAPNDFSARFNDTPLMQLAGLPRGGWQFYSAIVTATGFDTLSFSLRDDPGYLALDDVRVRRVEDREENVPEPASLALACVGLAALAVARARRQG